MTQARNREIVRLRATGKTYDAIAVELGLSRNTVAGVCARAGNIRRELGRAAASNKTGRQDHDGMLGISRAIGFDGGKSGKGCRWPLWDDVEPPTHKYCDKRARAPGEPYCDRHASIAFQPYLPKLTAPSDGGAPKPGVGLRAGVAE